MYLATTGVGVDDVVFLFYEIIGIVMHGEIRQRSAVEGGGIVHNASKGDQGT